MIRLIKCHRKIREGWICFPLRNYSSLIAIDYCDVTRVRNIDENSAAVFFQLKSFGMRTELDRTDLFPVGRVNYGNTTAAKSDIEFFSDFIVTNVVGVIFKIQFPDSLE